MFGGGEVLRDDDGDEGGDGDDGDEGGDGDDGDEGGEARWAIHDELA